MLSILAVAAIGVLATAPIWAIGRNTRQTP
jgi:hypothetical protein